MTDSSWIQIRLEELSNKVGSGSTPKGGEAVYQSTGIPLIRSMNVVFFGFKRDGLAFLSSDQATILKNAKVATGDVLLNITGASIGRVTLAPEDMEGARVNQHVCIIRPNEFIDPRFLRAFLSSPEIQSFITSENYGVTRQALTKEQILSFLVPVPSLNEQKRIADKLDAVLARVDACRARLDRIPATLKRFRQSVLAAAVSGKLTADWRDDQSHPCRSWRDELSQSQVSLPSNYKRLRKQAFRLIPINHSLLQHPSTWSLATIGELYDLKVLVDFADGNHGSLYPRNEEFGEDGILFLTAAQIGEHWEISFSESPRLNENKARQLLKGWACSNDVLLTHNATVGRVALIENVNEPVLLGTSVTFYPFNEAFVLPRFARILFSSDFFQDQLKSEMEQTTRDQVPITKQVSLNFICPPILEQSEIVRRVETLFAFADRVEARYSAARARVGRLTPALLAKAFRGELVPQDPADEPASALLARLRASRDSLPAKPGKTTKRSKATKQS